MQRVLARRIRPKYRMHNENLNRLAALMRDGREELLTTWREEVYRLPGAEGLDAPTINDQVPQLLDSLAEALVRNEKVTAAQNDAISAEHGLLRWQAGFDVTEVVAEYNILRGCVQSAAERDGIILSGKTIHIVNGVLDQALGRAVKGFETMMTIELQHRHEEHIGFVLHDLRTPLEAMSLATTLLEHSLEARSDSVNSALSVLHGNINRLSDRVRQVMGAVVGLGRAFKPEFSRLNLRGQVDQVIHDLDPLAGSAGTTVSNDVPADIEIYSDARLLSQIIQNLLSNALKFTPHGTVQIGARRMGDNGTVECWVKDSGEGIPPERLEKVFERFETDTHPKKRGIGLGLAIVKEIVELHKGEIWVESEVGQGSTFTFVIPGQQSD
jgi:two-component system, OmpR family, phosphate regulon sensor histidine kinase PhoR